MSFDNTHVQYVLAQFAAGASTLQILDELQSRYYLPNINIAMIEQCLRDNGRSPSNQKVDRNAINLLSPANRRTVGSSAVTEQSDPIYAGTAMEYFATADDRFANTDIRILWDSAADELVIAAYEARKSEEEIWVMLRSRGYNVTRAEVVASLARQRVNEAR